MAVKKKNVVPANIKASILKQPEEKQEQTSLQAATKPESASSQPISKPEPASSQSVANQELTIESPEVVENVSAISPKGSKDITLTLIALLAVVWYVVCIAIIL